MPKGKKVYSLGEMAKIYSCSTCGYSTGSETALKLHAQKTHNTTRKIAPAKPGCPKCGIYFEHNFQLLEHGRKFNCFRN